MDELNRRLEAWDGLGKETVVDTSMALALADSMIRTGWDLMHGIPRDEVLSPTWEPLQQLRAAGPLHSAIVEITAGSFRSRRPPQIVGSGYVVQSLEAALWAFHDARDFRTAVLKAVNLGDDADTTGAVSGQFAGAYWGESGIPQPWLNGLAMREMIEAALAGQGTNRVARCT